jgi:hypothetical protein
MAEQEVSMPRSIRKSFLGSRALLDSVFAQVKVVGRLWSCILVCSLAAGCAAPVTQRVTVDDRARVAEEQAQQALALQSEFAMTLRLWSVGYGVLKASTADCTEMLRPSLGIYTLSTEQLPAAARNRALESLGVDANQRIFAVYRSGAAEAAGVKPGDVILSSSAGVKPAKESRGEALQRMPAGVPVKLTLQRGGETVVVDVVPDMVCDYPLQYRPSNDINAFADGSIIYVTRGMMRFAADDRELALVIAHELAHNTMGHRGKKTANATVGLLFDVLGAAAGVNTRGAFSDAGARAFSQDFEREADHVGMFYLAQAGYPTEGAAQFWRRMATEHPDSIRTNLSATHPATAERFIALERIAADIRDKQGRGEPLTPARVKP